MPIEKEIGLAYLPSPGMVRLRLSSKGFDELELHQRIDTQVEKVKPFIDKYIYGYEEYGKQDIPTHGQTNL